MENILYVSLLIVGLCLGSWSLTFDFDSTDTDTDTIKIKH